MMTNLLTPWLRTRFMDGPCRIILCLCLLCWFLFLSANQGGPSPTPPNVDSHYSEPIMNKFLIFRLNFSWGMSKMHYFSNKFSKIVKLNDRWWPEVAWFGQIVVFQTDYDEIGFKKQIWCHFSDVITITPPKKSPKFFHFGPLPIKISSFAKPVTRNWTQGGGIFLTGGEAKFFRLLQNFYKVFFQLVVT